jgi:predicted enzyme related to lactoylglutathione lyase
MITHPRFVPLNGDPTMEAVDVRGKFVWHQLMTRDVPGAKDFYSRLVGWKTMPWPLDPAYTVCHAEVGPVAGIMQIPSDLPSEVPSHWLQYIGTRDVDSTAQAAVRAGGSIVKGPSDMQGAGRYAVLKDPQGAIFAIIDPENAKPEPAGPPLGAFSWHELATSDNEAAFAFYSGLFGWDAMERMDMGPVGVYLIFGEKGMQRGGIYIKPAENPGPPSWLPYVHVPNADEGYAVALSKGAKGTVPPMDVPKGGRIANVIDPAGASFAVHSMGAVAKAAPAAQAKPKAGAKSKTKAQPKAKTQAKAKAKAKPKKAAPAKRKSQARKKVASRVAKARKGLKKVVRSAVKKYRAAKKKAKSVRRKK